MLILIEILIAVYYISINVYSFLLMKSQKQAEEEGCCHAVRDGNIFISAILGGALGVYIAIFALKYRMKSLILMVFMPVLIVLNLYILISGFINNFWLINLEERVAMIIKVGVK